MSSSSLSNSLLFRLVVVVVRMKKTRMRIRMVESERSWRGRICGRRRLMPSDGTVLDDWGI